MVSFIASGGIVVAVHGIFQWRKFKKQDADTQKAKLIKAMLLIKI